MLKRFLPTGIDPQLWAKCITKEVVCNYQHQKISKKTKVGQERSYYVTSYNVLIRFNHKEPKCMKSYVRDTLVVNFVSVFNPKHSLT